MSRHHRYSGLAKGREWERARQHAFRRAGRRCERCGKAGRLEVHHRLPVSSGGTNASDNLQVLCRTDHIALHRPPARRASVEAWETLVAGMRRVV